VDFKNPQVRVTNSIVKEILTPVLWKVQCVSGVADDPGTCPDGQLAYFMDATPPDGCVCDENGCGDPVDPGDPCNQYWSPRLERASFAPVEIDQIYEIRWVEKDIIALKERRDSDMVLVRYELYPINFWNFENPYEEYYREVNAHFPYNVLPDANTVQTIRYTMASGVVVEHQFNITDTSPMPNVSATKMTEDGIKATIKSKETKSGLKIVWNDPKFKEIMKPGIQLRVYVGNLEHANYMDADTPSNLETFMWIDCPAQLHKLLIPTHAWNAFKDRLLAAGHSEADIMIVCRTIEEDSNFGTVYKNRGHSEIITIPLL